MQKLSFLICFIFLFFNQLFSQVNVQSGSAQFDLPIFNFSDGKSGLSHQVSISYSSGNGLKVNDLPSGMGQGWQLVCGGSIIRRQKGEPDDQSSLTRFPPLPTNWDPPTYYPNIGWDQNYNENIAAYEDPGSYSKDYVENYYPNGYHYTEFPVYFDGTSTNFPYVPKELAVIPRFKGSMDKRWQSSKRALADKEQDIFSFNFNGLSGEFVIGKNGEFKSILDSKLIFEKTEFTESEMSANHVRTKISSFKITDENGIIYYFTALNFSEVMRPKEISNTGGDFSYSVSGEDGTGFYTVDGWNLTKIRNPFTNEEIVFSYEDEEKDFIAQRLPSYQNLQEDNKDGVNLYEIRVKGKEKRLKTIAFPGEHLFEVNYDGYRQDLGNGNRITNLKIKYKNNLVTQFSLTHEYFYKKEIRSFSETFSETDKRFLRLSLSSVQKQAADGTTEPPYQFIYNTGSETTDPKDIVPPTDCFAQDHWGYYNKASNVDINQATPTKEVFKDLMINAGTYRSVSAGTSKFGLIKTIKNPTGGEVSYEYGQNNEDIIINSQTINTFTGGVHVTSSNVYDGINHANDITTGYEYKLENGNSSQWGYEAPVYSIYREIKVYKDVYGYKFGGVLAANRTASLAQSLAKSAAKRAVKGVLNASMKTTAFNAGSTALTTLGSSVFVLAYAYVVGKMIEGIFYFADPFDYEHSNNYQFYPVNYSNGLGTHFSRVTISNISLAGGTGKIIQHFSKPASFSTETSVNNFPYSTKQRFAAWRFDLLAKETKLNSANNPVSETIYGYDSTSNYYNNPNFLSCKVAPNYLRSARVEVVSNQFPLSDLSTDFYYPLVGSTRISSTTQKNYSNAGVISETNASVQYNSDYLPNITTATKSNGDQVISKTYYSNDYNSSVSAAIAALKSKNAIAIPVSTETWLKKAGTNDEFLIDGSINEFIVLPNNDVKVGKVYALENKEPLAKSIVQEWNNLSLIRSTAASYFKLQTEFTYNTDGNLVETKSKGNQVSSNIIDYNKRFVTAVISNAPAASVAYTSFETDNGGGDWVTGGGWYYHIPSVQTGIELTPTGNKSYSLSLLSATVSCNVTINRDYILSFWAKTDAGIPVVNASSTLSKKLILGDWTYFEYKINQGSGSPYLQGPGIIDELRLYPDNAKMATTTYDPTKGKTSECDINNRIVYYDYDGLGRIVGVRDEKRNLIKTYEYHFKN